MAGCRRVKRASHGERGESRNLFDDTDGQKLICDLIMLHRGINASGLLWNTVRASPLFLASEVFRQHPQSDPSVKVRDIRLKSIYPITNHQPPRQENVGKTWGKRVKDIATQIPVAPIIAGSFSKFSSREKIRTCSTKGLCDSPRYVRLG